MRAVALVLDVRGLTRLFTSAPESLLSHCGRKVVATGKHAFASAWVAVNSSN